MKYLQKISKIRERERERVETNFGCFEKKHHGMTLIEIMIVIVIIAILSLGTTWAYSSYMERARDTNRKIAIKNLDLPLRVYLDENAELPSNNNTTCSENIQGLPSNIKNGIWCKGEFDENIKNKMGSLVKNNIKDPKNGENYEYYTDSKKLFYIVKANLEVIQKNPKENTATYTDNNGKERSFYYATNFDEGGYDSIYNSINNNSNSGGGNNGNSSNNTQITNTITCSNNEHLKNGVCEPNIKTRNIGNGDTAGIITETYNANTDDYIISGVCNNSNYKFDSSSESCIDGILTEPITELLGKRVFIPNNGVSKQWATDNTYGQPIWNEANKRYDYPSGRTKSDYPAFEYCQDRGMRLPTKGELMLLTKYESTNNMSAYFVINNIKPELYWSSDQITQYTNNAWGMNLSFSFMYANNKKSSGMIICIPDKIQGNNWAYNMDISFDTRFEEITSNGVSVYRDKLTGLKWEKSPSTSSFNHANAITHCSNKGNGFRLPTIYELGTIISINIKNPKDAYSIHPNITNNTYCSSSLRPYNTTSARIVVFGYGGIGSANKNNSYSVICIQD